MGSIPAPTGASGQRPCASGARAGSRRHRHECIVMFCGRGDVLFGFTRLGMHFAERRNAVVPLEQCGGRPHAANGMLVELPDRSEEHTSELQSLRHLVCRLLLEKKKTKTQ